MKKLLISTFAAITALCMHAAPISPEAALDRVRQESRANIADRTSGKFKLVHTERVGSVDAVYLFSRDNGEGFIVAPADDSAPALLGYGTSKLTDEKGEMAPGFAYWISELGRQIEYNASHPAQKSVLRISRPERAPIATLCTTLWNQSEPYNDQCPEQNGQHTVTGCVATAMAQVMKYHNWPDIGNGEVSIKWQGRTKKINLSRTIFKWEDMLDTYDNNATDAQRDAVSLLMIAAGYSVNMSYSLSGSGAQSINIAPALGRNFRYDKSLRYLQRDYYNLVDWEDIIYNSLKTYGPVIYDGQAGIGGHSFVCDGYQSDGYFHFNWGWGGMSDGYFLLDALDPTHQGIGGADGGFNFMQDIIVDIRPDRTDSSTWAYQMLTQDPPEFEVGVEDEEGDYYGKSYVLFNTGFYNFGPGSITDAKVGFKFAAVGNESKEPVYVMENVDGVISMYSGFSGIGMYLPELEDGRYYVTVAYTSGDATPRDVMYPAYYATKAVLIIEGGNASMEVTTTEAPDFTDFKYSDKINKNEPVRAKGTLTNVNDTPYPCFFSELILDETQAKLLAYSIPNVYDLDPGESIEIDQLASISGLSNFADGYYYFTVGDISMISGYVALLYEPQKIYIGRQSSVDEVLDSSLNGTMEYYDANGYKVAVVEEGAARPALPAGLYIVKSAGGTMKVIIR